jgi:integrase
MSRLNLKYVQRFEDRHGHVRHYFRRKGQALITLPGEPGSKAFMDAYAAALDRRAAARTGLGAARSGPGTVAAAVAGYFGSVVFLKNEPSTQRNRRRHLEKFRDACGHLPIAQCERENIDLSLAARAKTPAAANDFLKALRGLFKHALEVGMVRTDPTAGVIGFSKKAKKPHRTWSEEDIAAYYARWPLGTKQRLGLDLMLYTAQRSSDARRFGRQLVRDGLLDLRQQKTDTPVWLPIHPELAVSIAATPSGQMTFLMTKDGQPYSEKGIGNFMRDACDAAGLPECSAHGLRKASLRRLAEAGCSAKEMQAISGHKTLRELEKYVEAANQRRLAQQAIARVIPAFPGAERERESVNPRLRVDSFGE